MRRSLLALLGRLLLRLVRMTSIWRVYSHWERFQELKRIQIWRLRAPPANSLYRPKILGLVIEVNMPYPESNETGHVGEAAVNDCKQLADDPQIGSGV